MEMTAEETTILICSCLVQQQIAENLQASIAQLLLNDTQFCSQALGDARLA